MIKHENSSSALLPYSHAYGEEEYRRTGKAMDWHYVALRLAGKYNEMCIHLAIDTIKIIMASITEGLGKEIKFRVSCSQCDAEYERTSTRLSEKFVKFYGLARG